MYMNLQDLSQKKHYSKVLSIYVRKNIIKKCFRSKSEKTLLKGALDLIQKKHY